jgi:hypothetical protein
MRAANNSLSACFFSHITVMEVNEKYQFYYEWSTQGDPALPVFRRIFEPRATEI